MDRGLYIVTLSASEGSGEGHDPAYLASLGMTENVSLTTLKKPCLLGRGPNVAGKSMGKPAVEAAVWRPGRPSRVNRKGEGRSNQSLTTASKWFQAADWVRESWLRLKAKVLAKCRPPWDMRRRFFPSSWTNGAATWGPDPILRGSPRLLTKSLANPHCKHDTYAPY